MTGNPRRSYLDILVLPELRSKVLSATPVVVFDSQMETVIWANAAGARLFGGQGVSDLLEMQLPATNQLILQMRHAARTMGDKKQIIRGFRLPGASRATLLQFELLTFATKDGNRAIRVSHLSDEPNRAESEREAADAVVQSLLGLTSCAALLNKKGRLISAAGDLDSCRLEGDKAPKPIRSLLKAGKKRVRRSLEMAGGNAVSVELVRLQKQPERYLLMVDEPLEAPDKAPEPEQTNVQEPASTTAPVTEVLDSGESDRPVQTSQDQQPTTPSKGDEAEVTPLPERFAWTTDVEGRFISVSDDLAQVVGSAYSAILGRQWKEVAEAYALDPGGDISALFELQNTWSGKIVLWPCGARGENRQEIELAALPAFDNDRTFTGFRGFGKFLDLLTGGYSALDAEISNPQRSGQDGDTQEARDVPIRVKPIDHDEGAVSDTPFSSANIVPFSGPGRPVRELTDDEQAAFRSVGEHLSDVRQDQSGETSSNSTIERESRSILEKLPISVLVYNNDRYLFANRNFLTNSGYPDLETLSQEAELEDLINGIASYDSDQNISLVRKDGRAVPINPVLHTVSWQGERAALLSFAAPPVVPDFTSIAPEERMSEIQGILDTTSDGIILMQTDGQIISFNASAEALFGVDFTTAEGQQLQNLFAEESREAIGDYIAKAAEDELDRLRNDGAEAIAREAGGGLIPVFVTINKMPTTGKLCAVLRDITHWKKAEEELIQSRQTAERSSEHKSEFLAQVSHEIRTPLNAIIGFSDVMIEERFGPIGNDRYREYLTDIKRSGTHVLDIVNGLLDLSRIESGKLELSFEAVNLNEVVAETVALLQPQANSNRTIIRTSLSRSVPKVVADPRSIRQIILNLVANAIKYSQSNGQVIVSTIFDTNGEVALRVRDTGKGMTEEQINTAMEPFRQAHENPGNIATGHGLGLPLTKALVEANRAYFELESEPGEGTIAHVQFPSARVLTE